MGSQLFFRSSTGLEPTSLGELLFDRAKAMESEIAAMERTFRTADSTPKLPVRLTAAGVLWELVVGDCIIELRRAHPEIEIELFDNTRIVNLVKREADIAFRMVQDDDARGGDIIRARRIFDIDWAFYGTAELVERLGLSTLLGQANSLERLENIPMVIFSDVAPTLLDKDWVEAQMIAPEIVMRCNTAYGIYQLVRRGLGIGLIPTPHARAAGLVRFSNTIVVMNCWLAIHPDLIENPHIRKVYDFITEYVTTHFALVR